MEADGIECILMEVLFKKSKPLLVGQVYRPPNTSDYLPEDFNEKFETMLEKVCCEEKEALLLGDLNCDYKKEQNNRPLKSIASRSGFSQMVTSPTRITEETASLIDLVLTNMPQNITKAIDCDSGCSDHCMIGTVRKLNSLRFNPRVLSCRNYKNYNSAQFNNDLKDAPWGGVYNASDLEKTYDNFEYIVAESVEKHAPMVQRKVRGLHCPWRTKEITDLIKTRDYRLKRAKISGSKQDWPLYRQYRNMVNASVRRRKTSYNRTILEENAHDPKQFWKMVKKLYPTGDKPLSHSAAF